MAAVDEAHLDPMTEPAPAPPVGELLESGKTYYSVHFSGCGFMLPFHFGVVKALMDHDIRFETATGSSGGVMAALALLGGADLELGIRQCFDLGMEPGTVPGSVRSFFKYYRQYFRCFRKPERVSLAELKNRLFIQLARVSWKKGLEVFSVSDFKTEQELEDAFMSAAYIPGGTSIQPPGFRGETALDVACSGKSRKMFTAENKTLWPPRVDCVSGKLTRDGVKLLVTPHRWDLNPEGLHVIKGDFRKVRDFWAGRDTQEKGFIQGYMRTCALIKTPIPKGLKVDSVTKTFDGIMSEQRDWKVHHSFDTPDHLCQWDPWMALPLLAVLLWILIEERPFLYFVGAMILLYHSSRTYYKSPECEDQYLFHP